MVIVSGRGGSGGKAKGNRNSSTTGGNKSKDIKAKGKASAGQTKDKTPQQTTNKKKDKPLSKKIVNKTPKVIAKGATSSSSLPNPQIKNKLEKMVTSNNCGGGPRIHAQRKFAQAGNVYSGTLHINTNTPSPTPTSTPTKATPLKRSLEGSSSATKKTKKAPFSPPANKRPRTEDFITFLCFRGTPSLPPELDFFNYPPVHEAIEPQLKKKGNASVNASLFQGDKQTVAESKELSKVLEMKSNGSVNHTATTTSKNDLVSKGKGKSKDNKDDMGNGNSVGTSKGAQKTPNKQSVDNKTKKKVVEDSPTKSTSKSANLTGLSSKAENPTKGIRATASNVLFSKLKKPLPVKRQLLSPTRSRLNEQDARFAMSALKLKYQRMASSKPNHTLLLTKKVKDRSVILTRSKARSGKPSVSPKRRKIPIRSLKPTIISPSRNAPSPDIIFGVTSSNSPAKRPKPPSSSSGSESETKASSSESGSSSESEDDKDKASTSKQKRSLRSGKELVTLKSPPEQKRRVLKKKKAPEIRRVGTRSAFRVSNSPLRELPMYSVTKPKTKIMKKKKKTNKLSKKEESKSEAVAVRTTRSKKVEKDTSGKRPSRKTKETAAFYLGLLTTGFSTDDEDFEVRKGDEEDEDSELGSSSSSETKFLEKHYNAAIKRNQQNQKKSGSKGKNRTKKNVTKSKDKKDDDDDGSDSASSSSSEAKSLEKSYNASQRRKESIEKANEKTDMKTRSKKDAPKSKNQQKQVKKSEIGGKKKQVEKDRDDQSIKSKRPSASQQEASAKTKRKQQSPEPRKRQTTPTVGDRKMPGAARKSAAIVSRRRSRYSSSSENSSSSSDKSSSSESEDNKASDSDEEVPEESENVAEVQEKGPSAQSKKSKVKDKVNTTSDSDDEKPETKSNLSPPPRKSSASGTTSGSSWLGEESKTIASEMRRLVEQKRAVEAGREGGSPSSKSATVSRREDSVETEKCKISRAGSRSPATLSSSSSSSSSSEEEESSSSDDEETVERPKKVDMCTQVDMDEEEGIAPTAEQPEETTQPEQPQQVDDSDDDIQEIAQVFSSSTTSTIHHQFTSHHVQEHSVLSGNSRSSSASATSTLGYSSHQHHHQQHLHHQQQQQQHHEHQMGMGLSQFNPFIAPRSTDFYTPLQLTPSPLVHSSIHLVGSSMGAPSFPVSNPLNTMSIPVSVPHLSSLSSPFLAHPSGLGFASGSTFHSATTLQTHIRSVATNLDIPLVRPVVGSDPSLNFMGRSNAMGFAVNSSTASLTRPHMGMWNQTPVQPSHVDHSRNYYSAFRVPLQTPQPQGRQVNQQQFNSSNPGLPVSIVQSQTQHQYQPQQAQASMSSQAAQSQSARTSSYSNPSTSSSSSSTGTSATPPGYNIIKNLPNVSIVPKFDRNSKPVAGLPSQEPGPSSAGKQGKGSSSKSKDKNGDNKTGERKKAGRKKKDTMILPQPSSPLTVRRDSNPATYVGISKKQQKKDQGEQVDEPDQQQQADRKEEGDKFNKLLKMKKGSKEEKRNSPGPSTKGDKNGATKSSDSAVTKTSESKPLKIFEPKASKSSELKPQKSSESKFSKSSEPKPSKSSEPKPSKSSESKSSKPSEPKSSKSSDPKPSTSCDFSSPGQTSSEGSDEIREAPTYYPTDHEFEDPLKYIQKIQGQAEQYGMARIVPPSSFRPECNVEDDMRFTAYNHYIHKMYQRWGPTVLETQMIKENLRNSQVDVVDSPMIGGMEVNLSALYQTVKSFGGLKEVIEKEKWTKVADTMHIPKAAHDRATKLDGVYVKYVLPYEILSDGERDKLKKKVEKLWSKRKDKILKAAENSEEDNSDEDSMDELDECIVKGKTTPLSTYFRVARNTANIFFPTEKNHSTEDIEEEYWKIVRDRNRPVCVYSGSIDCAGVGWGFPIPKASSKHPWNLKVLANNQGSVLRSMGPVMGATVPTLHVSMLFTTYCWYRDPHSLPWVEYLHSGANKIWYSVPSQNEDSFRNVLTELMPMQCKNKRIWLASDSAMVPPEMLIAKGVPLVRAVQNPGEFLVVFPKSYTSAICTGYLISESVCFAYPSWLETGLQTFKDIRFSKEPPVFPLEKLLLSILQDARASLEVVRMAITPTKELLKEETLLRTKITSLGVKHGGKLTTDSGESKPSSKKKGAAREEEIEQCYYCNYLLYLSMVRNKKTDSVMCLKHAVEHFASHKADIKKSILLYDFDEEQLEDIVENASRRCGNLK